MTLLISPSNTSLFQIKRQIRPICSLPLQLTIRKIRKGVGVI